MGIFGKNLLNTTVEVMCQTTGKTFHITSNKVRKSCRCWHCSDEKGGGESFLVELGEGKGNVSVTYYGNDGSVRKLSKIVPEVQVGLAQYTADSGTFILVSQEKV